MPESPDAPRIIRCLVCREPIEGLKVGAARGWLHPECGPEPRVMTFGEMLRIERQQPLVRYLLTIYIPEEIQAMILREFNRVRSKWR